MSNTVNDRAAHVRAELADFILTAPSWRAYSGPFSCLTQMPGALRWSRDLQDQGWGGKGDAKSPSAMTLDELAAELEEAYE